MSNIIPVPHTPMSPIPYPEMSLAGKIANKYAAENAFTRYQKKLSENTLIRQQQDLMVFMHYLAAAGIGVNANSSKEAKESAHLFMANPIAWSNITYGIVEGFVDWQLSQGYAIGSINVRLSTVKCYCQIASKAGTLEPSELSLIQMVTSYKHAQGRNVDEKREVTRKGPKKAEPVFLTNEQVKQLKQQPDTPQGRRDVLLICLLVDHGLRCGELAALSPKAIDLVEGTLIFYRKKVDKTQTHKLTGDTRTALMRYLQVCTPSENSLLLGSHKGGVMSGRMSERAITKRFHYLCQAIGVDTASAHDGRHTWATRAASAGTQLKVLQDAGGWNSIAMPMRYVESQKIANEGVKLD